MTKLKKIYLGNGRKMFEYATHEQLQEECRKRGISIGDEVTIGEKVTLCEGADIGDGSRVGDGADIGDDVIIGNDSTIGDGATVFDNARIGYCCTIGNDSTIYIDAIIADDVTIGNNVTIGYNVIILVGAKIKDGWKIENIIHLMNEYKYHVSGYIINGTIMIQMRCFTRTLEEWESDFWNNDKEFKKGSPEGDDRLRAFNKIKKIMKG